MKNYLESLQGKLQENLQDEKTAVEEACTALSAKEGRPVTPLDLAAILLQDKMNAALAPASEERNYSDRHQKSIDRNKERKCFVANPDHQRFFINVGFEDGADEAKLKAFILHQAPSLTANDFADVYLKGTFSFFEVGKAQADAILTGLENASFLGKDVHVEKTERPEGGAHHQSSQKRSYSDSRHGFSKDERSYHKHR